MTCHKSKTWCLHNSIWKIKTKTKPDRQLNAVKAGRRMPHPPNGHTLQTWAPDTNYNPRLALVPSPLIHAGKNSIYANRIITNYIFNRASDNPKRRRCCPGYRHKMVLCSHLEYPICDCVHIKSISPSQTPYWNMSLVASTKQWTAPELTKKRCAHRQPVPLYSMGHWHHSRIGHFRYIKIHTWLRDLGE